MTLVKTRGFSPVEAILIVVVVGIVTVLGLVFYQRFVNPDTKTTGTTSAINATGAETTLTSIETTADLDKAATALDSLDINNTTDTATIDAQSASF